jgi:hypothetical protein
MDIKTLVDYTQRIKLLRNNLELIASDISDEFEADKENQDRMGMPYTAELNGFSDAIHNLNYGLNNVNEGIAKLESIHRRSIRFKEQQTNDKKEDKKEENP